jgi:hypothetical protein
MYNSEERQVIFYGEVNNENLCFEKLPKLRENAQITLIVKLRDIVNREDIAKQVSRCPKFLIPCRTKLFLKLTPDISVAKLNLSSFKTDNNQKNSVYVEASTTNHMFFDIRGGKVEKSWGTNILIDSIQELSEEKYESLNQAFFELSKLLRPKRKSHSYNIYKETLIEYDDRLRPLDDFRQQAILSSSPYGFIMPIWVSKTVLGSEHVFATFTYAPKNNEVIAHYYGYERDSYGNVTHTSIDSMIKKFDRHRFEPFNPKYDVGFSDIETKLKMIIKNPPESGFLAELIF